jgi:hypothetical protein
MIINEYTNKYEKIVDAETSDLKKSVSVFICQIDSVSALAQ